MARPNKRNKIRLTNAGLLERSLASDGIELKVWEGANTGVALVNGTTTGSLVDPASSSCLNGVPMADGYQGRSGRNYTITSIHIRGSLQLDNYTDTIVPPEGSIARLILFIDHHTNGSSPDPTQIIPAGDHIYGFRDLHYTDRYSVLWDYVIELRPTAGAGDGSAANDWVGDKRFFEIHRDLCLTCTHSDNATSPNTTADIRDNSLHLMAFTDDLASGQVELAYLSRIRYYDGVGPVG